MASRATTQACELCRRRKVKCDGLPTCSNCHNAEALCNYPPPKKRGPKPAQWSDIAPGELLDSPSPATELSGRAEIAGALAASNAHSCPAATSPVAYSVATNFLFSPPESQIESAIRVHSDLLTGLHVVTPSHTAASITNHCIDLYTQYVFGAIPMCHEATLRATAQEFFVLPSGRDDSADHRTWIFQCLAAGKSEVEHIKALRNLTLLTAMCAAVTYVVPESLIPNKHLIAPLFLQTSRNMLRIYEDYDLEHPDSSSLTIRMFLSSAIQIATGTRGVAFHILNEACLIAMKMRLYDESAVSKGQDPIEETILRNAFWQLYTCDKTALVIKGRPVTIHEPLFETELTLQIRSQHPVPLFDRGTVDVEDCLLDRFHVIRRLWTMAARVTQAVESARERTWDAYPHPGDSAQRVAQLSEAYFEMITLTDNPPLRTQSVGDSPVNSSPATDTHFSDILQRQRTSYLITLHSIKVFVLSSVIESNMAEIVGLSTDPLALAMRQVEQAQDFLNVFESVPFLHLQAEGEQCVS
ncbi:hypothetical protein BJY00DRAFT_305163 [Aspergillus carlsbadensis]|nr:hypothetical protein BJY00DRAFT_305163 [Aspergillus carlsbadensis]